MAKKQEEIQFYKMRIFKLKQQLETARMEARQAKLRAKSASENSDYRQRLAQDSAIAMRRAQDQAETARIELQRAVRGGSIPYDMQAETTMSKARFDSLPEFSYSMPDLDGCKDGFMWKRNATPEWSPYFGIANEWLIGQLESVNLKYSMARIKWYKVNIQG